MLGYESDTPVRCLTHSFAVHSHYEVAPPYPQFVPHVSMACPGVAVFNTGDSLVALDIHVDTSLSRCCLVSVQFASDLCPPSLVNSGVGADDVTDYDETLAASESAVFPATPCSSASTLAAHKDDEQATADTPTADPAAFPERKSKLPMNVGSPGVSSQWHLCVCSSETVAQCEDKSHVDTSVPHRNTGADVRADSPPTSMTLTSSLSQTPSDNSDSVGISQTSNKNEDRSAVFDFPVTSPQLFDRGSGLNVGMYRSLSHATSTSCSPAAVASSPVIVQNDTQCFTYSIRRYSSAVTHTADIEGIDANHQHVLAFCLTGHLFQSQSGFGWLLLVRISGMIGSG